MDNILLVDDDPQIRHMYGTALKASGFSVTSLSDGASVLSNLKAKPYQAVILDVILPNQDGIQILTQIKHLYPDLPVIIITNLNQDTVHENVRQAGADACFEKIELTIPELLNQVQKLRHKNHSHQDRLS